MPRPIPPKEDQSAEKTLPPAKPVPVAPPKPAAPAKVGELRIRNRLNQAVPIQLARPNGDQYQVMIPPKGMSDPLQEAELTPQVKALVTAKRLKLEKV